MGKECNDKILASIIKGLTLHTHESVQSGKDDADTCQQKRSIGWVSDSSGPTPQLMTEEWGQSGDRISFFGIAEEDRMAVPLIVA